MHISVIVEEKHIFLQVGEYVGGAAFLIENVNAKDTMKHREKAVMKNMTHIEGEEK